MWPRALRFLFALLLVAFVGAAGLVHLPWLQDRMTQGISRRLHEQFGLRLQLDHYRFWPPGKVSIRGVRVDYGDFRVLSCDRVLLNWTLKFERPYLAMTEVWLTEPVLHLEQDQAGHWRLPLDQVSRFTGGAETAGSAAPGSWPSLRLPVIRIDNGRIIAIREDRSTFSVDRVSGTIQLDLVQNAHGKPEFHIRFGAPRARFDAPVRRS